MFSVPKWTPYEAAEIEIGTHSSEDALGTIVDYFAEARENETVYRGHMDIV